MKTEKEIKIKLQTAETQLKFCLDHKKYSDIIRWYEEIQSLRWVLGIY